MKSRAGILAVLFAVFIGATLYAGYPAFNGMWVNDNANVISLNGGKQLNDDIDALKKARGVELVVVTVTSLDGREGPEYAKGIMDAWGVGEKGVNNGIVFLLAPSLKKCSMYVGSGVRDTLTRDRAIAIRDATIERMQNGSAEVAAIEAVHAIMDVFGVAGKEKANATNIVPSAPRAKRSLPIEPSSEDDGSYEIAATAIFYSVIALVVFALMVVWLISAHSSYREEVLSQIPELKELLQKGNMLARNEDVRRETRAKFNDLRKKFEPIVKLSAASKKEDWGAHAMTLYGLHELAEVMHEMRQEIALTAEARKNLPALMETVPAKIADMWAKIAESRQPEHVAAHLSRAEEGFRKVEEARKGMSMVDYYLLYLMLNSIDSDLAAAAHAQDQPARGGEYWTSGVNHSASSSGTSTTIDFPTITLGGGSSDSGYGV